VVQIRSRFQERREHGSGPLERLVRRVLGLDLKAKQYAEGSRFVAAAVAEVGMEGFNRVWDSAETLPTLVELRDPPSWVARVHGRAA
jgi:putative hydrolase